MNISLPRARAERGRYQMEQRSTGGAADKRAERWQDGGAEAAVPLEVSRALARRSLSDPGLAGGSVLPSLRPAERRALALVGLRRVLAGSACQSAVLAAVTPRGQRPRRCASSCARSSRRGREGDARAADLDVARLLRAAAGLGAGLVAGSGAALGAGRDASARPPGGAQRQRALPRQRHPGRLARAGRQ